MEIVLFVCFLVSVFTSNGVINGVATISSVERYDVVKIKTTELETEPPFSDSVAYGLVKTYCWSWKHKRKNTPVRCNTVQFQALTLVDSSASTFNFNNLVFTGS